MDKIMPVALARKSLEYYLKNKKKMPVPANLPEEMIKQAGVFVSLKKHGKLRGCIGTFGPTQDNIADEIITNAISAGVHDPRFSPVTLEEMKDIEISVDILSEPEQVYSLDELDAKIYGVIVRCGHRSGLLLPDLEGVDTVEEQIYIAKQKAGISDNEEIDLYRFKVERYR